MLGSWRAFILTLTLAVLAAACSEDRPLGSDANPLSPAAKATCTDQDIVDLVDEMLPDPGLEGMALTKCANIQRQFAKGETGAALDQAVAFIGQALELANDGQVSEPSGGTLEEGLEELFALFLALAGVQDADQTVAVGFIDGDTGGDVVAPDGRGGLSFDPDDLIGDIIATVFMLPGPNAFGECPFSFDPPQDCFPEFWDFSIVPEENLVGTAEGALCLVDPPDPLAPDSDIVPRIRGASESDEVPNTLVFWPLADGPSGVDCDPPIILGLGDGPFARLVELASVFRARPAYAAPGKLGMSIGSFSPFAPADPGTLIFGTVLDTSEDVLPGATVTAENDDTEETFTTAPDADGNYLLAGLPFGDYTLSATATDCPTLTDDITLDSQTTFVGRSFFINCDGGFPVEDF